MIGSCTHCHGRRIVSRYRIAEVGLRHLCDDCEARLAAMGLVMVRVTHADPRQRDYGQPARRRPGLGHRFRDLIRRGAAA